MNVREMQDDDLLWHLCSLVRDGVRDEAFHAAWAEVLRRLARNPRCPTCGKEQPVYSGPCAGCATGGLEVMR